MSFGQGNLTIAVEETIRRRNTKRSDRDHLSLVEMDTFSANDTVEVIPDVEELSSVDVGVIDRLRQSIIDKYCLGLLRLREEIEECVSDQKDMKIV